MTLDDTIKELVRAEVARALADRPEPAADGDYLTEAEAAQLMRRSPRTLRSLRSRAEGPKHVRTTQRGVLYARADVLAWLASRTRGS